MCIFSEITSLRVTTFFSCGTLPEIERSRVEHVCVSERLLSRKLSVLEMITIVHTRMDLLHSR